MTTRDLMRALGMTRHALDLLAERAGVQPSRRVGIARLWAPEAVERLRKAREAEREARFTRAMEGL